MCSTIVLHYNYMNSISGDVRFGRGRGEKWGAINRQISGRIINDEKYEMVTHQSQV